MSIISLDVREEQATKMCSLKSYTQAVAVLPHPGTEKLNSFEFPRSILKIRTFLKRPINVSSHTSSLNRIRRSVESERSASGA